jgi:hypothetical protein
VTVIVNNSPVRVLQFVGVALAVRSS